MLQKKQIKALVLLGIFSIFFINSGDKKRPLEVSPDDTSIKKAKITQESSEGITTKLEEAIISRNLALLEQLLKKNPLIILTSADKGFYLLKKTMEVLSKGNSTGNATDSYTKMQNTQNIHKIVSLLLEYGADPYQEVNGTSAIMEAIAHDEYTLIDTFVAGIPLIKVPYQHGAKIGLNKAIENGPNKGLTPLLAAIKKGGLGLVKYLVTNGASPFYRTTINNVETNAIEFCKNLENFSFSPKVKTEIENFLNDYGKKPVKPISIIEAQLIDAKKQESK